MKNPVRYLEVSHKPGMTWTESFLENEDLVPVPPEQRTWGHWNFVSFWVTTSYNINTWMIVSSMIQLGMSWWQAWICVWIGYGATAPFLILNSRPGAMYHITFPVVARTSFGMWGCLWATLNRGAMACIWYGVQASIGGSCVLVMLRAMWPSINNLPNHLPASAGITTRDFLCFFLFSFISLPFIYFPVHKIRHFFTVKSILVPIAGISYFVWCIVKAKGLGPIVQQPGTIHGSKLAWAMLASVTSCLSNVSTLIVNGPDFASRATYPSAVTLPQLVTIPTGFGIISFFGIVVSSSSQVIYGEAIWSPVDLLGKFLDDSPSHATRFGVWFIAVGFIVAQIGTNISANSVSAGCDLTSLFPRFINIRRGGYIAAIVGFCMCPWNLLTSSNKFTTYLSAYAIFLSSIAGVMVTEYWVVRRGHYRVADLYTTRRDGWYWYTWGINWRAYAAYISGILINVVGLVGAVGRPVPTAATHIYEISYFTGFGVSAVVYWLVNRAFPAAGASKHFEEVDLSGFFDDENIDTEESSVVAEKESISDGKGGEEVVVSEVRA
ncbi:NCS1 nucleoside transporter family [Neolentinus lepideus HHB14362 ss-1]|uniref:NCS1 nucleoside transporter family n=1 Tax=Neolentinus lepideus HHB14362 ss-1 TaxID=1314782 RepID=A0A165RFC2_9AGAM|nr:NCS1 nucleoside transporter family [Neolentinus lepideus HHB14362 ss-1]